MRGIALTQPKTTMVENLLAINCLNNIDDGLVFLFWRHEESSVGSFDAVYDVAFNEFLKELAHGVFIFVDIRSDFLDTCITGRVRYRTKVDDRFDSCFTT